MQGLRLRGISAQGLGLPVKTPARPLLTELQRSLQNLGLHRLAHALAPEGQAQGGLGFGA